jgi:chloramphenicol 3-O-phosphotransferase
MNNIDIIIINGPSCAGKTTICKEICKISSEKIVHLQADRIKDLYLSIFDNFKFPDENIDISGRNNKNCFTGKSIFTKILLATAKEIAISNIKVVIDTNIDGIDAKDLARFYLEYLKDFKVYFVGIDCTIEERLRRFELDPNKGRRNEKNIRFQSDVFEANKDLYNTCFDTSKLSGTDIAKEILQMAP